jgi:hypothetical protein
MLRYILDTPKESLHWKTDMLAEVITFLTSSNLVGSNEYPNT